MIKTAVLLTVFNRKDITIKGLHSLYESIEALGDGYSFEIYLTDDGSTDGTSEAIRNSFMNIHIVQGNGHLFWNRGMLEAWKAALESDETFDYYLWFNDDVLLYPQALKVLFEANSKAGGNSIISGAFCSDSGVVSYGGWIGDSIADVNDNLQEVDRVNGNLVLIPQDVYKKIGTLNPHFHHSYGDFEYGIRARKNNIPLYLTPNYVGIGERHDVVQGYYDTSKNIFKRIRNLYFPVGDYPIDAFYYDIKCRSIIIAIINFASLHFRCFFPKVWDRIYQSIRK